MLHDRSLLGYLTGGLFAGAAHYLDAIEDSISFDPTLLLAVGSIVALLAVHVPGPRRNTGRAELLAFRAWLTSRIELSNARRLPQPPGGAWMRRSVVLLLDRALAGERITVAELDQVMGDVEACGEWHVERIGVDAVADDRTRWLDGAARWRAGLIAAQAARDAVATDVGPGEQRRGLLASRRFDARLTQAELAGKLGVSARSVIRWEHGDVEPSLAHRRRLVDLLGGRPSDYEEEYQ